MIPLDEVSACVFEQTPRNMVLLLMGAAVVLTGLMLMVNHNMPMGIVALAIGGLMLFLGLKSKSNFRLYSTSGHFFACEAVEIDLSGNRKREFDGFCSGLVAARHRYITARSGGA